MLQDLTIDSCSLLRRIRISSPLVKSKAIKCCYKFIDINLDNPELMWFELQARDGMLPSIWMENPPCNENPLCNDCEADLEIHSSGQVEPGWPCKMREFLSRSCKFYRPLTLNIRTPDLDFGLQFDIGYEWLATLACSSDQLSHTRYEAMLGRLSKKMLPLAIDPAKMNGLLWTPQPTSVAEVAALLGDDFVQFCCEKVAERQGHSTSGCCGCWPHRLEHFKIETIKGSDYRGPICGDRHTIWIK
ncbi:uncharacterized protein LOC116192527 [Punica granatum]|uniref:Uncharacterized protein LOC116192527 n=2 Tax=Punica granatum TaxID=22663 RepID=A0A6P8C2S9_PUNGR|nr:uncharacterized protein LOC116192527 [Punica granatum]